jgi:aarF domain-containing kinase
MIFFVLQLSKQTELIVGKENAQRLQDCQAGTATQHPLDGLHWMTRLRLLNLYRKTRQWLDLIVDVHGEQIFHAGIFNGDSHVGNVLVLNDGRLGLIDFGQTKFLTKEERLGIAKVVVALNEEKEGVAGSTTLSSSVIAKTAQAMRELGFVTKFGDDKILTSYAGLFFDSDVEGRRRGFATPQLFFAALNQEDPLLNVPDAAGEYSLSLSCVNRGDG